MKITAWGNAVRHGDEPTLLRDEPETLESNLMNLGNINSPSARTDQAESLASFVNAEYRLELAEVA